MPSSRLLLVPLLGPVLLGCGPTGGTIAGGDCTSGYQVVAEASSWPGLQTAVLDSSDWGDVEAIRTQAQGVDVGAGNQDAVRVIDLLDPAGRRLAQADVWRTPGGGWRAGVWGQCTD